MNTSSHNAQARRGLAMLEMALALPILLFVMALIINAGTVGAWKVRALTMARLAVWEARWPRTGSTDPRPAYWPAAASASSADAGNISQLDDSRVDLPVVRGPLDGTQVDSTLLDPTRGARQGTASLTRSFPLLANLGSYSLTGSTYLLDNKWQYQRTKLSNSVQRRVPVLYTLAQAPASLATAYVQAVVAILTAPFRSQLAPLDHDDEFIRYTGGAPDFQPKLNPETKTLDHSVMQPIVDRLLDRIQGHDGHAQPGVPITMTYAFLRLYGRVIAQDQALLNAQPPPSKANQAQLQADIAQLQAKVDELKQFKKQLLRSPNGS